jgi:exopolysaccharide biosynthesis polyprenyl glycosylphosphotransferase
MSQLRSSNDLVVPSPRTKVEGAHAPTATTSTISAGTRRLRRSWFLLGEVTLAAAVGGVVAATTHAPRAFSLAVIALALMVNYHAGRETVRPGLPHVGRILKDLAVPVAGVSLMVAVGVLEVGRLSDALLIVSATAVVAVAATFVRRAVEGQVRLLLVGGRTEVAKAASRWAGDRRAKVVGALVLETELDGVPLQMSSFGLQAIEGIDEVATWANAWSADMAVVIPGPGVTSASVRQLAWDLEDTATSFAVMGVLDTVAPHRIESSRLSDATLIHVRRSRPSGFVRLVKFVNEWVLGVLLFVALSPVIALMILAVRLDSAGSAVFKQTRVGRDGRHFTMYKMRTMVRDAEAIKDDVVPLDQGNGVLFKIQHDPRITRVGWFLRRSSLDELPQLINVLKGEMALIGPRPALPDEVEKYDAVALRRLAVRPGITGLWQVSGRSTLSWERSLELDLDYADNWRLTDDVVIGLRTVDAVARRKGAY